MPPDTDTLQVREWCLVDTDGEEHKIVRGIDPSTNCAGNFRYDTFPPFRDFFQFPKCASIEAVENWICENFKFNLENLPCPYTGGKKSTDSDKRRSEKTPVRY